MAILVSLLYGGVVRYGNQKVMATHDSLLLCGACPCVEGCHYREYNTKRASRDQIAILVSLQNYQNGGQTNTNDGQTNKMADKLTKWRTN